MLFVFLFVIEYKDEPCDIKAILQFVSTDIAKKKKKKKRKKKDLNTKIENEYLSNKQILTVKYLGSALVLSSQQERWLWFSGSILVACVSVMV